MKMYFCNCVSWNPADVHKPGGLCDMIDYARTITRRAFLRNVDRASLRETEAALGYPMGRLTMAGDWAVSYHRSKLHGQTVYYFRHSAIEYVFTEDGEAAA